MSQHGSGVSEVTTVVPDTASPSTEASPTPTAVEKGISDKGSSSSVSRHDSPLLTPSNAMGMTPLGGSPAQSTCLEEGEEACAATNIFSIPIVGYEITEERARFTVYKLRVENKLTGDCWFVYRRYTDFVRLLCKLKNDFPGVKLSLPKKRWFRDNFDSRFLEGRIQGLQAFVNEILQSTHLCASLTVKDFFCLNEPPSYAESMEESRVIFEVLEETVFHLRCQVQERDLQIELLKKEHDALFNFIRMSTKDCPRCFKDFASTESTPVPLPGATPAPAAMPAATSTPLKDIAEQAEDGGTTAC